MKRVFTAKKIKVFRISVLVVALIAIVIYLPLSAFAVESAPTIGEDENVANTMYVINNGVDYTEEYRRTGEIAVMANTRGSFENLYLGDTNSYMYSATVYFADDSTNYGSIRLVLGTGVDANNNNKYIEVCIRPNQGGHQGLVLNGNGETWVQSKWDGSKYGTIPKAYEYTVKYDDGKISFWVDNNLIFNSIDISENLSNISLHPGFYSQRCNGTISNIKLWGDFRNTETPKKPESGVDYADVMQIHTSTEISYENDKITSLTDAVANTATFSQLPFGTNDTYVYSFNVNTEKAEETWMGPRIIFGTDVQDRQLYVFCTRDALMVVAGSDVLHQKSFSRELNREYHIDLMIEPNAVSIWVDDILMLDRCTTPDKKETRTGILFEYAVGYMSDIDLYYPNIIEKLDVTQYRSTEPYTAPTKNGFVFAGWYSDENCKTALGTEVTKGKAYAKFVPATILSIKAQISANLLDIDTTNDDTGGIRFITSVDSLQYKEIGYEFRANGGEPVVRTNNYVYSKLWGIKMGDSETAPLKYVPNEVFHPLSKYFKAHTFYNISSELFDMKITANAFWVTLDGTKVYSATVEKSIEDGIKAGLVFVSHSGKDESGYGSKEQPYATLDYALAQVMDGGTVYVLDTYTAESDTWKKHGKTVTITGGTLDFSAVSRLNIRDDVTFANMTLVLPNNGYVFANGNSLKIDENVTVNNVANIYGAGDSGTIVKSTNVTLLAGNYANIYGGGYYGNVQGDTNVYVGGNVHSDLNAMDHGSYVSLYGGSVNGIVEGNANITVCGNAKFNRIFGGGYGSESIVGKNTNVKFMDQAQSMSIYGGSYAGTVAGTVVEMTGGTVEQVFGGSQEASVTGNTDVRILGGTIVRRIYGGCYNDSEGNWPSSYQVIGNASVTLGKAANLAFNYDGSDIGTFSTSRYKAAFDNERGTVIFSDGTYNSLRGKLGSQDLAGWITIGSPSYHYLVKVSEGGKVYSEGDSLRIVPDEGYMATVSTNEASETFAREDTYLLPTASKSDKITITVTFSNVN